MTLKKTSLHAVQAALLAGGIIAAAGPALAQQPGVVVIETARPAPHLGGGTPDEVISLRRQVSYADLDLATQKGDRELEKRISEAATAVCAQLDKIEPSQRPEDTSCVSKTVDRAMVQARAAISAASAAAAKK